MEFGLWLWTATRGVGEFKDFGSDFTREAVREIAREIAR